jgi:cellulose synthase/poly-beta-1,6-N-acetylglucosamine synthase-like glycosyltransferase
LVECVESITEGSVLPGTVLIVHRETDEQTAGAAESLQSRVDLIQVNRATVDRPGHLPPVEKGVEVCETKLMVLLDDDTVVKERWLGELLAPLQKSSVGVVGGPAVVPQMEGKAADADAGRLRYYGQVGGGLMWMTDGETREVDTVAEGNSAWRTDLLRSIEIPNFLYEGDSKFYGLFLTLTAKDRGYHVLFNPEAFVWHYPGERDPSLDRTDQHRQHWLSSRNYARIMLRKRPWGQALLYYLHAFTVGTYGDIGLLRALYMLLTGDEKWNCVFSCGKGRMDALFEHVTAVSNAGSDNTHAQPASAQQ